MLMSVVGVALIVVVMLDLFWTTLTTRGSGYCTKCISQGVRWLLMSLRHRFETRTILMVTGPIVLVLLGLFWIATLWLGWFLVYSGLTDPVVDAQTGVAANTGELAYYVGFTLSTLGIGDFRPQGTTARLLTSAAAFNGLVLITLFITYVIPVVSAAISRRKVAFSISLLGDTPVDMLRQNWTGSDFRYMDSTLQQLGLPLIECTEQRLAYPVVDYFFSRTPAFSLSLQLAKLDEALSLASTGLEESSRPDPFVHKRLRGIIAHYLESSTAKTASEQTRQPELPLAPLRDWASSSQPSIGLRSPEAAMTLMDQLANRRKALVQLVQSAGWNWEDVHRSHLTQRL